MRRYVGLSAPDFTMETALGDGVRFGRVSLSDFKGNWFILFFYPLDFSFVCPTEITAFSDHYEEFTRLGCEILGVSTDSKFSHRAWINTSREDNGLGILNYPLASDSTHQVSRTYAALDEEQGIALRSLFIIDPEGIIRYQVVTDENVGRSVEETLRILHALQTGGLCPADWKPGQDHLASE